MSPWGEWRQKHLGTPSVSPAWTPPFLNCPPGGIPAPQRHPMDISLIHFCVGAPFCGGQGWGHRERGACCSSSCPGLLGAVGRGAEGPSVGLRVNSPKTQPRARANPSCSQRSWGPGGAGGRGGQRGPHLGTSRATLLPCSTPRPCWIGGAQGALQTRGRVPAPQGWHRAPWRAPAAGDSTGTATATPSPCRSPPRPRSHHPTDLLARLGGARLPVAAPRGARLAGSVRPRLHWHRWVPRGGSCPPASPRPLPAGLGTAPPSPPSPAPSPHSRAPASKVCVCVCVSPPSRARRGGLRGAEPWHSSHPCLMRPH